MTGEGSARVSPSRRGRVSAPSALAVAVVALGAALRLWAVGRPALNPFYDAAVRSMSLSWHNFFFGAIEPGGSLSIDKPPVDLWLQVLSTKLLGFNAVALHLPEAVGGTVAVALLYGAVRAVWGWPAAILAALALAVAPISVLTSRSDTMDSVMTALLVGALWASVRGLQTRRPAWVLAAAALVGVAFNVKLTQALVPLPGLAVMWWAATASGRRLPVLAGAGATFAVVGMSWIVLASLTPAAQRPYPVGSGTGSIYRVVFVFNGVDRLRGSGPQLGPSGPTHAGPLRLVGSDADYGQLIGVELVAALALAGALGLAEAVKRRPGPRAAGPAGAPAAAGSGSHERSVEGQRVARWTGVGLGLWLAAALSLFSVMRNLETRYLDTAAPALAAVLGVSAAALIGRAIRREGARYLAGALALGGLYALSAATDTIARACAVAVVAGAGGILLADGPARARIGKLGRGGAAAGVVAGVAAVALFVVPLRFSLDIVDRGVSDAAHLGYGGKYSSYLRAHRGGARYEVASSDPLGVVGLVAADAQPVLILNDVKGPLVRLRTLEHLVSLGDVRYVLLAHPCRGPFPCPSTTSWSLRHAVRVSGFLYRVIGASRSHAGRIAAPAQAPPAGLTPWRGP